MTHPQYLSVYHVLRGLREAGYLWMDHGNCRGADAEAHDIWVVLDGLVCLHPGHDFEPLMVPHHEVMPRRSHLLRNRCIVARTGVLVAAPRRAVEEPRGGTWYTVRRARQKGSTVLLVLPTGEIVLDGCAVGPTQGELFS